MSHLIKITATCEQCKGTRYFIEQTELFAYVGVADTAGKYHGTPEHTTLVRNVQCPSCEGRGTVERFVSE